MEAITMKVLIMSNGTNPHIVAKFQTDRLKDGDEDRPEKNKEITASKSYTLAFATISTLCRHGGVKKCVFRNYSPFGTVVICETVKCQLAPTVILVLI